MPTALRRAAAPDRPAAPRAGSPHPPDAFDFPMSNAQFGRVAALVERHAGIVLPAHKRHMIRARLARRLRALRLDGFAAYLDLLDGPEGGEELAAFVNAATTNHTAFFREGHHFDHLRDAVLAPLRAAGRRRARIWSAGCSSGEEPWSIAIAALGAGLLTPAFDLRVLASDLDTAMLARGEAGLCDAARLAGAARPIPAEALLRRPDGSVSIAPRLRRAVVFRRLNLLDPWPFHGPFDAIFCRNVMIYFAPETRAALARRFAAALAPDGALYLGHAESLPGRHPLLRRDGTTTYRRRA